MIRVTLLSILVASSAALPIEKIINGTDAVFGEIPYIVSLRSASKSHSCGGSILDATHVLTAAHCVRGKESNPSALSIQYGLLTISKDDVNAIPLTKIAIHPEYSHGGNYENDVAVLTLASAIPLGDSVRETYLPKQGDPTPGDQAAVLAGWGALYTWGPSVKNLQRVNIKVYTNEDCESAHEGRTNRNYHVCAGIPEGGKGQCSGDSGGPLTVDGIQVGIVSWSVKPCTLKGYPGVFARVSNYVDWIREQMTSF